MFVRDIWTYLIDNVITDYVTHTRLLGTNSMLRRAVLERTSHSDRLFISAARFGYTLLADCLEPRAHLNADVNFAIRSAAAHGHEAIVRQCLADANVDPAAVENEALRVASQNGHTSIVQLLLQDERIDPTALENEALRYASHRGYAPIVAALLKHSSAVDPAAVSHEALRNAVMRGHTAVLSLLLKDQRVDVNTDMKVVQRRRHPPNPSFLREDVQEDVDNDTSLLRYASAHGFVDIVALLLADARLSTKVRTDARCVYDALQYDHAHTALCLLNDKTGLHLNVDQRQRVFVYAAAYGHSAVLKLMLPEARLDACHTDAFVEAATFGHVDCITLLLAQPTVDPCSNHCQALRDAAAGGYLDIVNILLDDDRVRPHAHALSNDALQTAASRGHVDIVRRLLKEKHVDAAECEHRAVRLARAHDHENVVKLLAPKAPMRRPPRQRAVIQDQLFRAAEAGDMHTIRDVLAQDTLWFAYGDIQVAKTIAKKYKQTEMVTFLRDYIAHHDRKSTVSYARRKLERWQCAPHEKGFEQHDAAGRLRHYNEKLNGRSVWQWRHDQLEQIEPHPWERCRDERQAESTTTCTIDEAARQLSQWQNEGMAELKKQRPFTGDNLNQYCLRWQPDYPLRTPSLTTQRVHPDIKMFFPHISGTRFQNQFYEEYRHIYPYNNPYIYPENDEEGGSLFNRMHHHGKLLPIVQRNKPVDSLLRVPDLRLDNNAKKERWAEAHFDRETMHEPQNIGEYQWDSSSDDETFLTA